MYCKNSYSQVPNIQPVDGWELLTFDYEDGDRFTRVGYTAHRAGQTIQLNTSCYFFTPCQERFAWIVESGFPSGFTLPNGIHGPLDNFQIDRAIAAGPVQVAA